MFEKAVEELYNALTGDEVNQNTLGWQMLPYRKTSKPNHKRTDEHLFGKYTKPLHDGAGLIGDYNNKLGEEDQKAALIDLLIHFSGLIRAMRDMHIGVELTGLIHKGKELGDYNTDNYNKLRKFITDNPKFFKKKIQGGGKKFTRNMLAFFAEKVNVKYLTKSRQEGGRSRIEKPFITEISNEVLAEIRTRLEQLYKNFDQNFGQQSEDIYQMYLLALRKELDKKKTKQEKVKKTSNQQKIPNSERKGFKIKLALNIARRILAIDNMQKLGQFIALLQEANGASSKDGGWFQAGQAAMLGEFAGRIMTHLHAYPNVVTVLEQTQDLGDYFDTLIKIIADITTTSRRNADINTKSLVGFVRAALTCINKRANNSQKQAEMLGKLLLTLNSINQKKYKYDLADLFHQIAGQLKPLLENALNHEISSGMKDLCHYYAFLFNALTVEKWKEGELPAGQKDFQAKLIDVCLIDLDKVEKTFTDNKHLAYRTALRSVSLSRMASDFPIIKDIYRSIAYLMVYFPYDDLKQGVALVQQFNELLVDKLPYIRVETDRFDVIQQFLVNMIANLAKIEKLPAANDILQDEKIYPNLDQKVWAIVWVDAFSKLKIRLNNLQKTALAKTPSTVDKIIDDNPVALTLNQYITFLEKRLEQAKENLPKIDMQNLELLDFARAVQCYNLRKPGVDMSKERYNNLSQNQAFLQQIPKDLSMLSRFLYENMKNYEYFTLIHDQNRYESTFCNQLGQSKFLGSQALIQLNAVTSDQHGNQLMSEAFQFLRMNQIGLINAVGQAHPINDPNAKTVHINPSDYYPSDNYDFPDYLG